MLSLFLGEMVKRICIKDYDQSHVLSNFQIESFHGSLADGQNDSRLCPDQFVLF